MALVVAEAEEASGIAAVLRVQLFETLSHQFA